jgi:hypothetical protein
MLYELLIIIIILIYLIYKQKPVIKSKEEINEEIQSEIDRKEAQILHSLKTSHLKNYMDTNTAIFENGRKNFLRLSERFKHDDIKQGQVIKDWIDYINTIERGIFTQEMLDVCTSEESEQYFKEQQENGIKFQEITKRFKDLLGEEYIDPFKKQL